MFSHSTSKLLYLVTAALALVCVAGCKQSSSTSNPTINSTAKDPKTRWLAGDPCKPPCFENITPGITKFDDVKPMLDSNLLIGSQHTSIVQTEDFTLLGWNYSGNSYWNGTTSKLSSGPATIQAISVETPDLCLKEIVAVYGEPDYLWSLAYQATGDLRVIWKEYAMMYGTHLSKVGGPITKEPCRGALEFIPVDSSFTNFPEINLIASNSDVDMENYFVPWHGYDYDYGTSENQP